MTTMPLATSEGEVGPRLLILQQGDVRAVALPTAGSLKVGRAEDADLRIDSDSISRRHAILHMGDALEVEDVGSSNGTKVGGQKIERGVRVEVAAGDLIEFGGVSVVVQGALEPGGGARKRSAMHRLSDVAERVAGKGVVGGDEGMGDRRGALRARARVAIRAPDLDIRRPQRLAVAEFHVVACGIAQATVVADRVGLVARRPDQAAVGGSHGGNFLQGSDSSAPTHVGLQNIYCIMSNKIGITKTGILVFAICDPGTVDLFH